MTFNHFLALWESVPEKYRKMSAWLKLDPVLAYVHACAETAGKQTDGSYKKFKNDPFLKYNNLYGMKKANTWVQLGDSNKRDIHGHLFYNNHKDSICDYIQRISQLIDKGGFDDSISVNLNTDSYASFLRNRGYMTASLQSVQGVYKRFLNEFKKENPGYLIQTTILGNQKKKLCNNCGRKF